MKQPNNEKFSETIEENELDKDVFIQGTPDMEYSSYGEEFQKRSSYEKVTLLESGYHRVELNAEADQYQTEEGEWEEIDNTLVMKDNDDSFDGYENASNSFKVRFAKNASQETLMRIKKGDCEVEFCLKERVKTKSGKFASKAGKLGNYLKKEKRNKKDVEKKCGGLHFNEVAENVDLQYFVEGETVKEHIVLKRKESKRLFEFIIKAKNVNVFLNNENEIEFIEKERRVFVIPAPFMEDADGNISRNVKYEISQVKEDEYLLQIIPSSEWLDDSERKYPVVIDPTVSANASALSMRCVTSNNTVYQSNRVGKNGSTEYRTYVTVSSGARSFDNITNATLALSFSSAYTGVGDIYVTHLVGVGSTATSFVEQGEIDDVFKISDDGLQATADVTNILRAWQEARYQRRGFSIFGENVSASSSYAQISSINLIVTYQDQKAKKSSSHQKNGARKAGNSSVDLYAGRLLFEHNDVSFFSNVLPLNVSHEYNSDYYNEDADPNMRLGYGWRLNVQQIVEGVTLSSDVSSTTGNLFRYIDGNGIHHDITQKKYKTESRMSPVETSATRTVKRYCADGNNEEYSTQDGLVLTGITSSERILTDKAKIKTTFNSSGKLKSVSQNTKTYTLTYSSNRITKITDGAGKYVNLTYDSNNFLTKMTDSNGRITTFGYSGNYLTSITAPDGTTTTFTYSNNRLQTVKDCSGFTLTYTYDSQGRVRYIAESATKTKIASTDTNASSAISGDNWTINYLTALQTQVVNRNGLKMEYIFNADGQTVSMYEDNRSSASASVYTVSGKVIHNNSYLVRDIPDGSINSYGYKTVMQSVNAVAYNHTNLVGSILNWLRTGTTTGDGTSSESSVQGGNSVKLVGNINGIKKLSTSISGNALNSAGVYMFGCFAKANSIAGVSRTYTGVDDRYFGVLVRVVHGTGGTSATYYASFDPYNTDWQYAGLALHINPSAIARVEMEVLYSNNIGTAYFDRPYFAKVDGGVSEMYDNNYSVTYYKDHSVYTLFDSNMNDVKNIILKNGVKYTTTNTFDSSNRPTSSQNYRNITTSTTYDSYGNVTEKIVQASNGLKMKNSNVYSGGNYQTSAKDEDGSATTFVYNANGTMSSSTMPTGQKVNYTYDANDALTKVSATLGGVENFNSITYKYGYIIQARQGSVTYNLTYDGFGRILTVKADATTLLTNSYTDFGSNLDSVSGAVSKVTSTDAMGNVSVVYTDKYGRTIATKDNRNANTQYFYDAADNVSQFNDSANNEKYTYTYTPGGKVLTALQAVYTTNTAKVSTSYSYDSLDRLTGQTITVNGVQQSYGLQYSSYPDEDLTSMSTPIGTITYAKDALSRLTSKGIATGSSTLTESYTYKTSGLGSSYTTQMVSALNFSAAATKRLYYTYDSNGNITEIRNENNAVIAHYEYDGLNRLIRENDNGYKTVVYSYDANGNITQKKIYSYTTTATSSLGTPTRTISYGYETSSWKDRLKSYNGATITYNAAGCPTTYLGKSFGWTNGRLTNYNGITCSYNDAGIRTRKGTTDYYLDGNKILAENRNGTWIYYYYDESGLLGFRYQNTKYYYRRNLQGDIIGIYNESGSVVGEYVYDAWGKLLNTVSGVAAINPFRYKGYYYDTETNLYYLNSRYYDPETGRFISPDGVDQLQDSCTQINGLNLYMYCYNNPVMMMDPNGTFTLTWWQKLLIGLAFITLGAVVTALTGGTFAGAFICAFNVAVKAAISGAIMGAVLGGAGALISGGNVAEGMVQGFAEGFCDGFMWGGITAGLSNVVKPGSFCFKEGTLVETKDGLKPIEEIKVGEEVLAFNEETGEQAYKRVVQLFRNETKEWYHIFANGEEVVCTAEHPFFVPEKNQFIPAKDLKIEDMLLLSCGECVKIELIKVEKLDLLETTYNFEVADFHTYYVSESKVLVHNKCVVKDGDYQAIVNEINEAEAPHAHILKNKARVAVVDVNGKIIKGSQERGIVRFISKYKKDIIEGIKTYYPKGGK